MIASLKRVADGKPRIAGLAVLVVAGLLGNYFSVPLFFGADFLFGSIAVLLVLHFYGLRWGIVAALIVHSYTYCLWGHPYGLVNFTGEALFVGCFLKRRRRNLILVDGLFWLIIGIPLVVIEHGIVMRMGYVSTAFIMFKQSINGVSNALFASLILSYLPLGRLFRRSGLSSRVSLHESIFNLLAMVILLPALLLTMLQVGHEKERLEAGAVRELQSRSVEVQSSVRVWYQLHLRAVNDLAVLAGRCPMIPSAELQRDAEILKLPFPDFGSMHVENSEGRSIAFDPPVNEKGDRTLGLSFSDKPWFRKVKATGQPSVSDPFVANRALFAPVVTLCVPVMKDNRWRGCATGALDLARVGEMLRSYKSDRLSGLTLTDAQNRVIASTVPERRPMQLWDRKAAGVFRPLEASTYLWHPGNKKLPSMTLWQQSFYVQESMISPDLPWKLTAEAPVAPIQRLLYTVYVKNLAITASLIALSLLISFVFSRAISRPLATLAAVTADWPEKLTDTRTIDWPAASTDEVNSLITNFASMTRALKTNFDRLRAKSEELSRANAALIASELNLSQAMDLARIVYWEVDPTTETFTFNDAFFAFYGTTAEAEGGYQIAMNDYVNRFIHPDDVPRFYEHRGQMAAAATSGPLADFEHRIIRRDGEVRQVLTRTEVVRDVSGRITRAYGSNQDITERRRVEESLQTSEMRLSEAADMARLAYWEADGKTGVFTFNDAFYDLIGTSAGAEGGYTMPFEHYFRKFVHPDDLPMVFRFVEEVQVKAGSAGFPDFEARVIRGDGEVRHMLVRLGVHVDGSGQSVKLFGINQDVTERKEMEETLRRSEELHRMLAENASDLIWIEDPRSHRITYVSPSVFRLTGYSAQEAMELPVEDRLASSSLTVVKEFTAKTLESASSGQHTENKRLELEMLRKDGSTIWTETVAGGMYNSSGDLVAVQGVSRDITERKRAEEALRTSQLRLSDAMDLARIVHWELDCTSWTFIFNDPFYAFLATTAEREGGYWMAPSDYLSRFVHPDDRPFVERAMGGRGSGPDSEFFQDAEHRIVRRDGETRHIVVRARVFRDAAGRTVRCYGANQDITERKQAETELARMNRALRMLSDSNEALIRIADEPSLLNEVCRIAVEVGGYRMAWVGFAEEDEAKTIRPVAHGGLDEGYLESANLTWAESGRGLGPAGCAIRTGKPSIVRGTPGHLALAHAGEAVRRGYRSAIALPLATEGRTFGVLDMYAGEEDAFDVQEVEILRELAGDLAFGIETLRTRAERKQAEEKLASTLHNLRKAIGGTIQAIVQVVEMRDPYTAGHQRRVADLARSIATEMGLPSDVIEGIRMAAVIHDIGKVSVPAEILSKPGRLTQNEFELIKDHAVTGYDILKDVEFPWPIAEITYQHHERLDGSGYPRGLMGDEVLLEARIIAVADVVEAIASHRPFRPAHGIEAALDEIGKKRGILYDPEVVDTCLKLFGERGYAFH